MKTKTENNPTSVPAPEKTSPAKPSNVPSPAKTNTAAPKAAQPKPFWFFISFVGMGLFAIIAWLGSISTGFPWLVLCGGCVALAIGIGLWLWGYHSHKPETRVEVKHIFVCQPQAVPQAETQAVPQSNVGEAIFREIRDLPAE